MHKKIYILLFFPIIFCYSCIQNRYSELRLSISGNSTIPVTIIIYTIQEPKWNDIFQFLEVQAHQYDHRIEGSPIYELNTQYQTQVPDQVFNVIKTAINIAEKSKGAFDPTILPLTQLWDFDNNPSLPDLKKISIVLQQIDYKQVIFSENNHIHIPEKYGIDLGGIAKGVLVDLLADYLNTKGYKSFLIEAGGDILVSGLKPDNKKWIIGIRNPRDTTRQAGELSIGKQGSRIAIVTSGDYEKFFIHEGIRYHHLINPHTGYPAKDVVSVTVIATSCMKADAMATAAFILGKEKGLDLLENERKTEGLIIYEKDNQLKTIMTTNFSDDFNNRIKNKAF